MELYKIIKSLGKGGMGEVFLAFDEKCHRHVALKQIRADLMKYKSMQERFLREAHIAAELTHPSIIPIFSINEEGIAYYTMPYVEGETVKAILRAAKQQELKGDQSHFIGGSIPALMRIFLSICQAIAYTHSKGILHRDLKPENIIVGKFGEVLLLDWGLADYIEQPLGETDEEIPESLELTRPGKVVGTLAYLAPERANGEKASIHSDLYALGVMLYELLTLKLPFKRADLQTFQKMMQHEQLPDPIEAAPYRDIPHQLASIAKKCLQFSKDKRYQNVGEVIADLESYIEGRPEWIFAAQLSNEEKKDWEFQENVLLAKHIAITRSTEIMEWVNLMISKMGFSGNIKIEADVIINGNGIGFLLSIPEANERKDLMDGYCLWIGSEKNPGIKLFRSNIEVMDVPDVYLTLNKPHRIVIEKLDNHLRFFLDDVLKCHYISHTPLAGTHVGLLLRDADFTLTPIKIYIGSQSVMVSCLAIPDAFLAKKDYQKALSEYRRIAHSFSGRAEGREALFRCGITLLEEGLSGKKGRDQFYSLSLEEFGKLRNTAGAPLEYLGKSLVYKATGEIEEEVKCLELAIRKFVKHPLRPRLIEHIVFRLHESSQYNRLAAYHFALLCLRQLPQIFVNPDNQKLLDSLKHNWEPLPFIEENAADVRLAFWLAKPITLMEIVESNTHRGDALFSLLELGCIEMIKENPQLKEFPEIEEALKNKPTSKRSLDYLFQKSLDENDVGKIYPYLEDDIDRIWALLLLGKWQEAGEILEKYPLELKTQENSPLYFLFGCYLWTTEGEKIGMAHFSGALETPYPRTTALLGHYLTGKINLKSGWINQAFFWEKIQLYRQLILFHTCLNETDKALFFKKSLQKERKKISLQTLN